MSNPEKVEELTESEKWECTVRWLNRLYSGYRYMLYGEMTPEEFLEDTSACYPECPYSKKCPSVDQDPYRPTVPVPTNFKVLEQFTPGLNVVSSVVQPRSILHESKTRKGVKIQNGQL